MTNNVYIKAFVYLSGWAVIGFGWTMNLLHLINCTGADAQMSAETIIRIGGVFVFPVGMIMGLFF